MSRRRVRTPTLLQMEAVECGAAALGIVLGHYGRVVSLEELRQECGVSRDGSKASNILKAARRYGMEAAGRKHEDPRELRALEQPVILFWNMNHFVVLEGFRGRWAYVNDPAQGPRRVTLEELDACFSGVVLTLRPGPGFERGGERPSTLRSLGRRVLDSKLALLYLVLCGLLLVVPGLVMPTFARVFVDDYLIAGRESVVRPLLVAMAATAAVMMALTWLQRSTLLRLETKLSLLHSSRFFAHLQRLPLPYFVQRYAGEIGTRMAINDRVAGVIGGTLTTTVINLFVLVFYLALMFWYHVTLTAVVVGVAVLDVLAVRLVARTRADASRRLLQDRGKLQGTAMGGLSMIETLKATGGEAEFFGRWSGFQAKCLVGEQKLSLVSESTSIVPYAVAGITTTAVYLFGGLEVMAGRMTIGMLVAYQTLVLSFTRPLGDLVETGGALEELKGDLARLDDVLRAEQDPLYRRPEAAGDAPEDAVKLTGRLELRDVTFGYSPLERPLLEGFELAVEPGQRVAIVGGSGSGKSTVAKLVAGLYEPWHGEVLLDGTPRQVLPRRLVVNSLAVVDQDVFLFGGTIGENVTMWDSTLSPARIVAACRDAAIHDVVAAREGGYQAALEEGGKNLSGGQRQRLEIARALVGDPTILVLDEATSALDPVTESQIDEALRRRGCTCLIVAHRLSTVRDADKIVVMHQGRIVQQGTHEEMKDVDGPYRELIRLA